MLSNAISVYMRPSWSGHAERGSPPAGVPFCIQHRRRLAALPTLQTVSQAATLCCFRPIDPKPQRSHRVAELPRCGAVASWHMYAFHSSGPSPNKPRFRNDLPHLKPDSGLGLRCVTIGSPVMHAPFPQGRVRP
jgi:hypothetical protein